MARYIKYVKSIFGISELHMVWFRLKAVKLLQQVVANTLLLVMLYGLLQSVRIADPDDQIETSYAVEVAEAEMPLFQSAGHGRQIRKEIKEQLHARFEWGRVQFQWDTETGFDVLYLFYTLVAYFFVYTVRIKLNEPA